MNEAEWNTKHPVGTRVRYFPFAGDRNKYRDTVTRSLAWTLGHGEAVVSIEGKAGGVSLRHLTVLPQAS